MRMVTAESQFPDTLQAPARSPLVAERGCSHQSWSQQNWDGLPHLEKETLMKRYRRALHSRESKIANLNRDGGRADVPPPRRTRVQNFQFTQLLEADRVIIKSLDPGARLSRLKIPPLPLTSCGIFGNFLFSFLSF